ncbi:MAG: hypothetical protein LBS35_02285 [Synergistaceae bacterium]|jgi:hypothetical protein|nr:hypothetical protein [Synergistaceae bacterium]
MYHKHCGAALPENTRFCSGCGVQTGAAPGGPATGVGRIGYSERIHDPAFAKYIKNTNRWAAVFSIILAAATVAGFYIAGETGADNMENPRALFIGIGIGGMFLLIALYTIISRKRSKTWDGVVVDKTVKKKTRRLDNGHNDSNLNYYTEYAVIVRDERGKTHRMTAEDDMTVFDYFQVGDRIRHHAGLNSYEKYDKSRDGIIFCNACATLCQISDDVCWRCKCPLLK